MGTEKDIIIAVELGSAAIRAIAGRQELDGTVRVLAVAQEADPYAIRRGVIDNIDRTTQALQNVVRRLSERLDMQVTQVYVGLGGQSLHTELNPIVFPLAQRAVITDEVIQRIDDMNRAQVYPNMEILQAFPQEYRIDNRNGVTTPVGMEAEIIRATFVNVLANTRLKDYMERCVERAGLRLAEGEPLIAPLCLAQKLLTDSERRTGCALVDIGAETTTVSVYTKGTLRHLAVIPLGGSNATADIVLNGAETDEAESLKRKYGTAYCPDSKDGDDAADEMLHLSYERTIGRHDLMGIVEARYQEIIANVWEHIRNYSNSQFSSVIFTGGGSRVAELTTAFSHYAGSPVLARVHKGIPSGVVFDPGCGAGDKESLSTLLSLLLCGKESCVSERQPVEPETLFPDDEDGGNPDDTNVDQPTPEPEPVPEPTPDDDEPKPKKRGGIGARLRKVVNAVKDMLQEDTED